MIHCGAGVLNILIVFWESLWQFCDIKSHTGYDSVLMKPAMGMIGTKWFTGATVNYAEHIFRNKTDLSPAIIFQSEISSMQEISWSELEEDVASGGQMVKVKRNPERRQGGIADAQYPGKCDGFPGGQ